MIEAIINSFDVWVDAQGIKSKTRVTSVDNISFEGVLNLRKLILNLAFSGKLLEQKQIEGSAKELLELIKSKENRIIIDINPAAIPYKIPANWKWCKFGDISNHNSGKTLDNGRNKGELRNYITTSNLYWGFFKLDTLKQIRLEEEELDRCTAIKGDLLICEGGEAGRSAVWEKEDPICFQNHIHRVRPLQGIDPYYLFIYMMKIFYSGEIHNYRKGVGIHNISGKALSSIIIPLAPIPEQRRIISKVNELMSLCDKLETEQFRNLKTHQILVETVLETLNKSHDANELQVSWERVSTHFETLFCTEDSIEQLKQTILSLAVMGKLVKQDLNDEPASELFKKITKTKEKLIEEGKLKKQSPLTKISEEEKPFPLPKGWYYCRLEALCSLITKGSSPKWQGVSYTENPNDVLFITSENVGSYKLLIDSKKYVELKFNEIEPRSVLEKGDFLMNIVGGSIGRTAIYNINDLANINQAVCLIRLIPEYIDEQFFLYFFNSSICISYMFDKQVDNARPNLSMGNISRFVIPLPPLAEQKRIVTKIKELFTICDFLTQKIKKNQDLKIVLSKTIVEKAIQ